MPKTIHDQRDFLTDSGLAAIHSWVAAEDGADLADADLTGADLGHADLRHADLRGADLTDADYAEAALTGALIREVEDEP